VSKRNTLSVNRELTQHRWRPIFAWSTLPEGPEPPITTRAPKNTRTASNGISQNKPFRVAVIPLCTVIHCLLIGRQRLHVRSSSEDKPLRPRIVTCMQSNVRPVCAVASRNIDNERSIQSGRQLKSTGYIIDIPTLSSTSVPRPLLNIGARRCSPIFYVKSLATGGIYDVV